jgi:hypothetical protein
LLHLFLENLLFSGISSKNSLPEWVLGFNLL